MLGPPPAPALFSRGGSIERSVLAAGHAAFVKDRSARAREVFPAPTSFAADRDLLGLCYFEGLTAVEIADRLGEPPERIRKRKSRAVERLRQALS